MKNQVTYSKGRVGKRDGSSQKLWQVDFYLVHFTCSHYMPNHLSVKFTELCWWKPLEELEIFFFFLVSTKFPLGFHLAEFSSGCFVLCPALFSWLSASSYPL